MPIIAMITCFFPFVSLPIIVVLLFVTKDIKLKKVYSIMFSISIGFILYKMIPRNSMDLFRYYEIMDIYARIGFNDFVKYFIMNIEPLMNLIFYIFSQFNDNHLIIVFTTLISYAILFYIIFDYQEQIKLSNSKFNVVLLYFLCTFLIIYNITGIRFCLARLLFFLALYLDFYKNKRNAITYLLYIISPFFHQSAFLLLFLRILLLVNKNRFDIKMFLFSAVALLFPAYFVNFFSALFGRNAYLTSILDKATKYVGYGNSFVNIYKLQLLLTIFIFLIIIMMKIKSVKTNKSFLNYSIMVFLICVGFVSSETISTRFIGVLCSFSVLIFMDFIKSLSQKNSLLFSILLFPFCIFYLAFQFIQFKADGVFKNLLFDYKYTIIVFVFLLICFIVYSFLRVRKKEKLV